MKMRAFTNHEEHAVHIAGKTIMPGDTREIPDIDHPDYQRPAPEPGQAVDAIAELAGQKVADIVPQLAGLDDEQLAQLDTLEHDKPESKQRKSLTEAIADEQLQRAQARADTDQGDG